MIKSGGRTCTRMLCSWLMSNERRLSCLASAASADGESERGRRETLVKGEYGIFEME